VHCDRIKKVYKNGPSNISSLNMLSGEYKDAQLRDFYIKTAYNCCALGEFKNTFVNMCALRNVLKQGARCLDFEIYTVDNKPVIAVSSINSYKFKQSFNYIDLSDTLIFIIGNAFSGNLCPNPNDPLILHFRIMTQHKNIIKAMAIGITNILSERLLDNTYDDEYGGQNLGGVYMKDLMGKIIISCNSGNKALLNTPEMVKIINIMSGSVFLRQLREHDILYSPDTSALTEYNKKNMTIALPNIGPSDKNLPVTLCLEYGIQMIAMCYQNFDSNMEYNEVFFGENGSAFVLKPHRLRYIQQTIPRPKPLPKNLSFAPRTMKTSYYNFKI